MKRLILLAIVFATTLSLSAQRNMQVWEGDSYSEFFTGDVDSVTFLLSPEGTLRTYATPQFKIENDYWFVSYDEGSHWTQLGKATGEQGPQGEKGEKGDQGEKGDKGDKGDSMFLSVTQDDKFIYLLMSDSTKVQIAKSSSTSSEVQPNSEFVFVVTYDANGGVGTMPQDTLYYGASKQLAYCKFTKEGCYFVNWNTHPDGSGISYAEGQSVTVGKGIKLYAQWNKMRTLEGLFSISDTVQVVFSAGNLNYDKYADRYLFAEHQYDQPMRIGTDLLTWGTGDEGADTFTDFGNNVIYGYAPNTWRNLTRAEWEYIIHGRANAVNLFTLAVVEDVPGVILLPDNWAAPVLITIKTFAEIAESVEWRSWSNGAPCVGYGGAKYYNANVYNDPQWQILETAGAVFIPTKGSSANRNGEAYWASDHYGNYANTGLYAYSYTGTRWQISMYTDGIETYYQSVRLVREAK